MQPDDCRFPGPHPERRAFCQSEIEFKGAGNEHAASRNYGRDTLQDKSDVSFARLAVKEQGLIQF